MYTGGDFAGAAFSGELHGHYFQWIFKGNIQGMGRAGFGSGKAANSGDGNGLGFGISRFYASCRSDIIRESQQYD